jgi:hypothetical protein
MLAVAAAVAVTIAVSRAQLCQMQAAMASSRWRTSLA